MVQQASGVIVHFKFEKPQHGFWDGSKEWFEFEGSVRRDSKGQYVRWDCYDLNHWHTTDSFTTWPRAIAGLRAWMAKRIKVPFKYLRTEFK